MRRARHRLRETHAIGLFTELEAKGQVNDPVDAFRASRHCRGQATIEQLRERYNLLLRYHLPLRYKLLVLKLLVLKLPAPLLLPPKRMTRRYRRTCSPSAP